LPAKIHKNGLKCPQLIVSAAGKSVSAEPHFELIEVFSGVDSICICYKSVLGLRAVEWLHFDSNGKVSKASAHYNECPK
jgi:hypothetical protein